MRARCANPCAVLRRDARLSSSRRSLSVKSIPTAVLPLAILRAYAQREPHISVRAFVGVWLLWLSRKARAQVAEARIRERAFAARQAPSILARRA